MRTIFSKVFTEFATILLLFFFFWIFGLRPVPTRDGNCIFYISCIARRFFPISATWEARISSVAFHFKPGPLNTFPVNLLSWGRWRVY